MISVLKKIWDFSGSEQDNIKKSILLGLVNAMFHALQLGAIYLVLQAIVADIGSESVVFRMIAILLIGIGGKIITQYISQLWRTHAGYFMVANKRLQLGDRLKRVAMGFFNDNSLGMITAVSTTILSDVENSAPVVLVSSLGGFLNAIVFMISLCFFDWRIGLVAIAGMAAFLWSTNLMEKRSRRDASKRQKAQAVLVEKVLETIQGMSVVKAFNLDQEKNKKVDQAIEESALKNMAIEKAMTPYIALSQLILNLFSVIMIWLSITLYLRNQLELVKCLMMLISSFMVFEQLKVMGSGTAVLRITETSIDQANELDQVPVMEEGTKPIGSDHLSIEFKNVSFGYEKRQVLKNLSFTIPEKTLTAIVGPSGSGKSTLCSLIARFWDVESGQIQMGGQNIKDYQLDNLLSKISMVFQNVYLFEDTIENNIKFGKQEASHEQVVEAAKKACCHDFISALPDGYQTLVGEGGASLSGGEKQRISIARAMLKDAPIVIFDEATANIDPENEDRLQTAIEQLTKDKTIIMIAHRLKTVRNADQILVLKDGEITQSGKHQQLIGTSGIYADFINRRKEAAGWKLVPEEKRHH